VVTGVLSPPNGVRNVQNASPSQFTHDAARQPGCNTLPEDSEAALQRSLGPVNLVLLGIGCIIGAGVYVMTGVAAANYAGPAVVLSFALARFACAFAALCYCVAPKLRRRRSVTGIGPTLE
jgi:amino acid permease